MISNCVTSVQDMKWDESYEGNKQWDFVAGKVCAFSMNNTSWRSGVCVCVCVCRHVRHTSPCVCSFLVPGEPGPRAGLGLMAAPSLGPVPLESGFAVVLSHPRCDDFQAGRGVVLFAPHPVRLRGRCLLFWVTPLVCLDSQLLEVCKLLLENCN